MKATVENQEFVAQVDFYVQNYKYIKLHTNLATVNVRMIDYSPVGESCFMVDGNEKNVNFKQWVIDCKFVEVTV